MALSEGSDFMRFNIDNTTFVHHAGSNLAVSDQFTNPCSSRGIVLVVKDTHRSFSAATAGALFAFIAAIQTS